MYIDTRYIYHNLWKNYRQNAMMLHNQSMETFKTKIRMSLSSIKEYCLPGCNHLQLYYIEPIEALQKEQCVSKMKNKNRHCKMKYQSKYCK